MQKFTGYRLNVTQAYRRHYDEPYPFTIPKDEFEKGQAVVVRRIRAVNIGVTDGVYMCECVLEK
jgi:hypothetical protein